MDVGRGEGGCTGAGDCTASPHIHGCYVDREGDCDRPQEHEPYGVSCSVAWRPYCGCAKKQETSIHFHIGRSWLGHPLEDDCPCGKAACGLVDAHLIDPACPQHALTAAKTMRQMHPAGDCPGDGPGPRNDGPGP